MISLNEIIKSDFLELIGIAEKSSDGKKKKKFKIKKALA